MVEYMPFTSWIVQTWLRAGCGGRVAFIFLLFILSPFYLFWLPFDLLICALRSSKMKKNEPSYPYGIVAIDLETTGLNPRRDEILSIAIVDESGKTLMSELVRPTAHKAWKDAQAINSISPQMVAECRSIATFAPMVQEIINGAEAVLIYNADFDRPFLENVGIVMTRPVIDVMLEYARRNGGRWAKLVDASEAMGIRLENAHDATSDAAATMEVYKRMLSDSDSDYSG